MREAKRVRQEKQGKGEVVRLVLTVEKKIRGEVREPEFVMLDGCCRENVTGKDISKAIQLGQLKVVSKPTKTEPDAGEGET